MRAIRFTATPDRPGLMRSLLDAYRLVLSSLWTHGDLVERVVATVPESRKADVIYFNVPNSSGRFAFNPLEPTLLADKSLAASGLLPPAL